MRGRAFRILLAFLVLAVFWTWPLAGHLSSRIPHDPGDPIFNIWLLWWNAHAVPFTERWWNPPMFFPMHGALALSEHLAGIGLITTPLQLLHASPLAAYNTALIVSFALSGFFTFLLVRRLIPPQCDEVVRNIGAFSAALAYGYGPYRAGQLAHLQVLTSQWMPLALLSMHAYMAEGHSRWLACFAAAWVVQALSNGYYLLYFPVLIALWLVWFVDWRRGGLRGMALIGAFGGASLLLVPILIKYVAVQRGLRLVRTAGEMVMFSARPGSFLNASGMLAFWPSSPTLTTEEFLFPGLTPIVLVTLGATSMVWARRRGRDACSRNRTTWSTFGFYAVAAVLMWALTLGPATPDSVIWLRPYTLLTYLPGFDGLRVPARFAMLATLCAAVAAGVAFSMIAPRSRTVLWLAGILAIVGLVTDGWMRAMPLLAPPGRLALPNGTNGAVLELPPDEGAVDVAAMYRQTQHGLPIINGYSGHTPPHYAILSIALRRGDPSVITELAQGRSLIILVKPAFDPGGGMESLVRELPGIESHGGSSGGQIYVLPALPVRRVAPDGEMWTAMVRDAASDTVEIDLGQPRVVRTIGFPLRWHYRELDRRIAIQGSIDGQAWSMLWEDWTGGPALAAALIDPLEVPVRITVPDVTTRYLRVHPVPPSLRQELRVYGPK
jgi:hypothetical protein